jgi:quinol monooxygenase YgiN
MYVIIWKFHAAPEWQAEFERAYGPDGPWVELFRRHPDYLGTELLRDAGDPLAYVTLDRWRSRAAHERFLAEHRDAYRDLDERSAGLCAAETLIGRFDGM